MSGVTYRRLAAQFAVREAEKNVREVGANNHGPRVEWYQKFDSLPGEGYAWCNSFVDACFAQVGRPLDELVRSAGVWLTESKAREHGWITKEPDYGCLVIYTFSHIGFFLRDNHDGTITTVEGNTGSSGAVSDSAVGGDGVYIKRRPKSLVKCYVKVPGTLNKAELAAVRRKAEKAAAARAERIRLEHAKSLHGYWAWLAWTLGEGPFKEWGPRASKSRPNVPRNIGRSHPTWWPRRAAYIAKRKVTG